MRPKIKLWVLDKMNILLFGVTRSILAPITLGSTAPFTMFGLNVPIGTLLFFIRKRNALEGTREHITRAKTKPIRKLNIKSGIKEPIKLLGKGMRKKTNKTRATIN
ncbi:hypothetical protein QSE00_02600 [Arenibacter sp. M-2]|nr:hypothetical protein [Arenibacter sp. M-2]